MQQAEQKEQRHGSRRRVLKAAKIVYANSTFVVDCTVRNMSDTGAKLRVDPSVQIPDTFQLFLKSDGLVYECVSKWRRNGELGVEFTSAPRSVSDGGTDRLHRIARLS